MTRVTNFKCAHWAAVAIEAFRSQVGSDDDDSSIHDLIADLGHYCSLRQLDFIRLCADAISCWQAELADPNDETIEAGPEVSILIAGEGAKTRHWRPLQKSSKSRKGRGGRK